MSQRPAPPMTPSMVKKRLMYQSPSPQQKSPRGKREEIVVYVLVVGCEQQGSTNRSIDIQLYLANRENRYVRVIKMGLKTNFSSLHHTPVKLTVTPPLPSDKVQMWLYNEKYGSTCEPLTHNLPYTMILK